MASSSKSWTVGALLDWAAKDFFSKQFSDARLSAEVLLATALKTNRVGLYLRHDEPVDEEEKVDFRRMVEERRRGTPVAYITGEKEFYSLMFKVNRNVLIPRPETELLVDEVISYLQSKKIDKPKICDVGTGSGAIAISLKKNIPDADVIGVDVSREALAVAKENALRNGVELEFVHNDLLLGLASSFDVVVANLPYVSEDDYESLTPEVRAFEPKVALVTGNAGLELIGRLAQQIQETRCTPALFLEIGYDQEEKVQNLLTEKRFTIRSIRRDYAGIPRVVFAERLEPNGTR